jgi:hypothetical protein
MAETIYTYMQIGVNKWTTVRSWGMEGATVQFSVCEERQTSLGKWWKQIKDKYAVVSEMLIKTQ